MHVDFDVLSGELGSHLRQVVVLPGWASSDILFHMFCFELVALYFFSTLFFPPYAHHIFYYNYYLYSYWATDVEPALKSVDPVFGH